MSLRRMRFRLKLRLREYLNELKETLQLFEEVRRSRVYEKKECSSSPKRLRLIRRRRKF